MPSPSDVVAVSAPTSTASAIYRRASAKDGFPTLDGVKTLYELFQKSVEAYRDLPALGTRPIDQAGAAGPFEWMTYGEVSARVADVASALAALGVPPQGRVGIYSANCAEWMIAMQACNRMSYECVPLYDSLGDHAVEFVLRHSQVEVVFVDARKLGKLAGSLAALKAGGDSKVRAVIYWGRDKPEDKAVKAVSALAIEVCSWEEALAAGAEAPVEAVPPSPDDYCTIMYTSGTTGDPKGVLLRHSAVVASVCNVKCYCTDTGHTLDNKDALLSYLPLAHIFDRVAEELMLHIGGRIGYFQGDTTKLMDDITALRPTLFIGVPRIFERIESGVMGQVARGGPVTRFLFAAAYQWKLRWLKAGWSSATASPLFDRLVFGKVKAKLGGRVALIVSGGAPLAPHVEEFLRVAMCAPVAQGYGLTECCAGAAIAIADDWAQFATNGPPLSCIEIRFASVPEMGYDATGPSPTGEVLLRGPCMFDGYYRQPDKTAEVVDEDGWFHTGDIGLLAPGGGLKIVDRMKNIFKLSQGEYIAVEKLEGSYIKSSPVEQIWVYGDSFKAKLVAVVVPKKRALQGWAAGAGKSGTFEELCADPAAAAWVVEALGATAKEEKLKGFERVAAVHLEPHAFSVEEELVTPTFKLKRPQLKKKYLPEIERMYAALDAAPAREDRG